MPESRPADAGSIGWQDALTDEKIGRDIVVLTSSRRLCRSLVASHNERMIARGLAGWATPPIFFWQDWLALLVDEAGQGGSDRALSPAAMLACWEQAIAQHLPANMTGVAGLARQAASSARLLGEWNISLDEVRDAARSADENVFARALGSYRSRLAALGYTDPTSLSARAIRGIGNSNTGLPARAVAIGFDRVSPMVSRLLSNLEKSGVRVEQPESAIDGVMSAMSEYPDEESELRAAGAWARNRLLDKPEARIAIVVSELEQDAERVERLVREGFAPGWQLGGEAFELSVEVSYGRRLSDYPVVASAIACLNWSTSGLDSASVSTLLRSATLFGEDLSQKSALELRLRDFPDRNWTPAALAEALTAKDQPPATVETLEGIRNLSRTAGRLAQRRLPSQWAQDIDELLTATGWPGDAGLLSQEFQTVNRWRELLNELTGLDDVLSALDFRQVVRRLVIMAGETVFQPERQLGALPVLGPLEAAGLEFDAVWVARCDADRWPAAGNPQPLIARSLQLSRKMPDATPADTLEYGRVVLSRLAGSAPEVRFSWSKTDNDAIRLPSSLLNDLGCLLEEAPRDPAWFATSLQGIADLLSVDDDPVPPMGPEETLAGGARTVQLQRQEPFSAFALGRLAIRELEPFTTGLTARLRGTLAHAALEKLYFAGMSQSDLAAWSADERRDRILGAVDRSLSAIEKHADVVLRRLLSFERQRTISVLQDVVDSDLARSSFTVEAIEQQLAYQHAAVRLNLRADRIDLLDDGSLLIIDYKTGKPRPIIRSDGEPGDLQLPIYATAVRREVGGLGLLFARPPEVQWRLIGRSIDSRPMEADEWRAMLTAWRETVEGFMEAISRGDVRVNLRGDAERSWQLNVLCRSAEEKRAV